MERLLLIALLVGVTASLSQAAVLESPRDGTSLSGLGFISGWKCDARDITITLNGGAPIPVAMRQPREDTRRVCGGPDNGFITQFNWHHLGTGEHTAVAYDDGAAFARSTFSVVTAGEVLPGTPAIYRIPNFPAPGQTAHFQWNESTQHLELTRVSETEIVTATSVPIVCRVYSQVSDVWHSSKGIRLCLAAGADPNLQDKERRTPLHRAPSAEAVRLLLAAGADPNVQDDWGETPLYRAPSAEATRLLLAAGADPTVQANNGRTPLHQAGSAEAVRLLLAAGADPTVQDKDRGDTPLQEAVSAVRVVPSMIEVIRLLLDAGADPDVQDDRGDPLLHEVVFLVEVNPSNIEVLRLFLDAGANPNAQDDRERTPLHKAIGFQDESIAAEVVRLLLDAGADPNVHSDRGGQPACAHLDARCVR